MPAAPDFKPATPRPRRTTSAGGTINVGNWRITVANPTTGEEVASVEYGKLVLDPDWALVLEPDSNKVKLAKPAINCTDIRQA